MPLSRFLPSFPPTSNPTRLSGIPAPLLLLLPLRRWSAACAQRRILTETHTCTHLLLGHKIKKFHKTRPEITVTVLITAFLHSHETKLVFPPVTVAMRQVSVRNFHEWQTHKSTAVIDINGRFSGQKLSVNAANAAASAQCWTAGQMRVTSRREGVNQICFHAVFLLTSQLNWHATICPPSQADSGRHTQQRRPSPVGAPLLSWNNESKHDPLLPQN